VSISSISNPTALLSQVTGKNPFAVATPFGAGSFVNTLLQELRQSGASTAAGSTSGASSATAAGAATGAAGANTTAGASGSAASGSPQALGHHHGHHGGGLSQLMALLQQNQTSATAGSSAATSATSSLQLQALLLNLKNGASATPGRLLSTTA
jgi:hypothetical protein